MQQGGPRKVGRCVVKGSACHSADNRRGSTVDPPVEVMRAQVTAVQGWKPQPPHKGEPTLKIGCECHTVMLCRARMYWQASRNTMGSRAQGKCPRHPSDSKTSCPHCSPHSRAMWPGPSTRGRSLPGRAAARSEGLAVAASQLLR